MRFAIVTLLVCVTAVFGVACTSNQSQSCSIDSPDSGCAANQACERVVGGSSPTTACFAPVEIRGRVFDLTSDAPLHNARVVAIDANGAAASGVATTDAMGMYTLRIPVDRVTGGAISMTPTLTLRADAQNYQSFPGGVRPAFPVDATMTVMSDAGSTVIQNATTDIALVHLAVADRGSIAGSVTGTDHSGVLVAGGGSTAISDRSGEFVLFNVTPGAVTVRGFAVNLQLTPAMTTVTAGQQTPGVTLNPSSDATGTVSGSLQLVNAGGVSATSVVLALRETYNVNLDRGEVPRGLRVNNISGAFTFSGVPDGDYVVLAAFENDGAVRDPDPGIGGTDLIYISMPAAGARMVTLPQSFKVTGALDNPSPGRDRPEAITSATPTFTWDDDSSEDGYEIRVFDALGTIVWENLALPNATGRNPTVTYPGTPALQPGMYYQFRATSWRTRSGVRAPIARTEELRGVFYLPR